MAGLTSANDVVADRMMKALYELLHREVEKLKEEIVTQATAEFSARIRQLVAKVTLDLANYYTVKQMGNEIVIRVKIENADKPRTLQQIDRQPPL